MSEIEFENELQKMRYEYYKLYSEKILPILRPFEVKRRRLFLNAWFLSKISLATICFCRQGMATILCVGYLFCIFMLFMGLLVSDIKFNLTLILWLITLIFFIVECLIFPVLFFFFICANKEITDFQRTLKRCCLDDILKIFGDLKWEENVEVMPDDVYEKMNICKPESIVNFDSFIGIHNDVEFKMTELPSICMGRVLSCFQDGRVLLYLKTHKKISSCIKIIPKEEAISAFSPVRLSSFCWYIFLFAIFACVLFAIISLSYFIFIEGSNSDMMGVICGIIYASVVICVIFIPMFLHVRGNTKDKKSENAKLEFEEFNRKFKVDATDQVDARYIITPTFMERYVKASKMIGKGDLHFYLEGNEVFFWTHIDRNLFELCDMLTPLDSPESANNLFRDLSAIYYLIDTFKFDEKTGL